MIGGSVCWWVNGDALDAAVEELFLETMVPSEIDLSIAVEREAHGEAASLVAQWQARIEQARYEARRAERRYKAVDPENRVVARTLEREWVFHSRRRQTLRRHDARRPALDPRWGVVAYRERYAHYDAWWLDIDDTLARKFDRARSTRRT